MLLLADSIATMPQRVIADSLAHGFAVPCSSTIFDLSHSSMGKISKRPEHAQHTRAQGVFNVATDDVDFCCAAGGE